MFKISTLFPQLAGKLTKKGSPCMVIYVMITAQISRI
jgi:hypothetical protein